MNHSQLNLSRPKGMSDEDYLQAKAFDDGAKKAKKEYDVRLNSIMRPAVRREYEVFCKEQLRILRAARKKQAVSGNGHKELAETIRRSKKESRAFLRQAGVKVGELKSLNKDVRDRMERLSKAALGKGKVISPRKNGASTKPAIKSAGHPITRFVKGTPGPPTHFKWPGNFSSLTFHPSEHHQTGEIGFESKAKCTRASLFDMGWVRSLTGMRLEFEMPSLGQLVVSDQLEVIDVSHQVKIDFTSKESYCETTQLMRHFAHVVEPNTHHIAYQLVGDFNVNDGADPKWPIGSTLGISNLIVPGVIPAHTTIQVDVGIEHYNMFTVSNCDVISNLTTRFLLRSVTLSSTGG